MARRRTGSLTANGQFTPAIAIKRGGIVTIAGTFTGTLALQRYDVFTSAWVAVTSNTGTAVTFTANGTYSIDPYQTQADYRVGFTAFTSGTAEVQIEGR